MELDRLPWHPEMHQGIAEVGQRHRKIRIERDTLLLNGPRVLIAFELEQDGAEVAMGVGRARAGGHRGAKHRLSLLRSFDVAQKHPEQMQRVEMIGKNL